MPTRAPGSAEPAGPYEPGFVTRVPWLPLAITALAAPLAAIALNALITRTRLVLARRLA